MVVAAFVAPYLLPATARFVSVAAELPDVRVGLDHLRARGAHPGRPARAAGRALADRRRARPAPARLGRARPRRADGPGGPAGGRPGTAAGTPGAGPRGPGHRGHGRAHRDQRARQVADEGDAAGGRDPVRPPRPGARARRGHRLRGRGRLPAGRQAAGRRGRPVDVPARRRRHAPRLAGGRATGRGLPRAARGVPHRRGAHLRQRLDRRLDGLVVDRRLPPATAGGAAQPVDPVDGRCCPATSPDRGTRASTGGGRRR